MFLLNDTIIWFFCVIWQEYKLVSDQHNWSDYVNLKKKVLKYFAFMILRLSAIISSFSFFQKDLALLK